MAAGVRRLHPLPAGGRSSPLAHFRTSVQRNVIANFAGGAWSAVMSLTFVPLYVRYLGMESYGLIGLFAVMQSWLTLLDMGMTPTLNREMARFTAGCHTPQSIRDLLRSLELLTVSIALLIGAGVWAASGFLAKDWLRVEKLPLPTVAQALSVMGIVLASRFVEDIYRSSLFGLQRQIWYNGVNAILATLRHGGAVAILAWVSPTVRAFFLWQAAMSLLGVLVLGLSAYHALPPAPERAKFSRHAIADVWGFAGGIMGITLLSVLLTQVDKILLSRLLTLEMFGYYTLAATIAGVVYVAITPVGQAIAPRMVQLLARGEEGALISVYHEGAQLITVMTAPVVMLLSAFAGGVVFAWSGSPSLALRIAPILSALVLGTFLNGMMFLPGQLQLASGWTTLAIKANVVSIVVLAPAIFWLAPRYGAVGTAWVWVALNAGYILFAIQFMHRRLIPREKLHWYVSDLLLPVGGALGVALLARLFRPTGYASRLHWLIFLSITGACSMAAATALASRVRPRVVSFVTGLLRARPA